MAKQLTIRGVSEEVGKRLESLSRARGQSVNTTVLELLESVLGVDERRRRLAR
jgi:predicted DNA-binding protein